MPIVQIKINAHLEDEKKKQLMVSIPELVSTIMLKPISDVMVILTHSDIFMDGSSDLAVFVDFKCISGLDINVSQSICEGFLQIFKKAFLELEASRVYINFFEVKKSDAWRFINNCAMCPDTANKAHGSS